MRNAPSNSDNIIDSRDIIERFDELESDKTALEEAVEEAQHTLSTYQEEHPTIEEQDETQAESDLQEAIATAEAALTEWLISDDGEEYATLKKLIDECEGYGFWRHGEALIADHYFETYAQQLADDIGAIDARANWPLTCIDWEQAADELKADYTEVDFDGHTYWMRS